MKRPIMMTAIAVITVLPAFAQRKPATPGSDTSKPKTPLMPGFNAPKQGPKPYKEIITDKAVSHQGLFSVHKVEDKWYFKIPDSLLSREFMAITRFSKTAGGGVYGGELANHNSLQREKTPHNTPFLPLVPLLNIPPPSTHH